MAAAVLFWRAAGKAPETRVSQVSTGLDSLCALVQLQQELLNMFFKAFYFLPREKS
ncbi:unnamed protein product [Brassica rapa subsp. trilocularis]